LAGARFHGVTTNRDLLVRTLRHPGFLAGDTDTGFLERHGVEALATPLADEDAVRRHAIAAALAGQAHRRDQAPVQPTIPSGYRNSPSGLQRTTYAIGDATIDVGYRFDRNERTLETVEVDGGTADVDRASATPSEVVLTTSEVTRRYLIDRVGPVAFVDGPDGSSTLVEQERFPLAAGQVAAGSARAPMPGGVVRVAVSAGDTVEAGQLLVVLEAMKMEHTVHATTSGVVTEVDVAEGDQVETGRILVVVEADDDSGGDGDGGGGTGAEAGGGPES
jgi:propionyl-CoA carboxylase alpha chain